MSEQVELEQVTSDRHDVCVGVDIGRGFVKIQARSQNEITCISENLSHRLIPTLTVTHCDANGNEKREAGNVSKSTLVS